MEKINYPEELKESLKEAISGKLFEFENEKLIHDLLDNGDPVAGVVIRLALLDLEKKFKKITPQDIVDADRQECLFVVVEIAQKIVRVKELLGRLRQVPGVLGG